jgi:hypothetical protein
MHSAPIFALWLRIAVGTEALLSNTELRVGSAVGNRGLSAPDMWAGPLNALGAAPECI